MWVEICKASICISEADPYDYGTRALTSVNDHTFTVTNNGGVAASSIADGLGLAAPFNWKDGSFPGTGGDCSTGLAASASCTIVVSYSPTVAGPSSDTIIIDYNNGLSVVQSTRDIQGAGANPAVLAILRQQINTFGCT